MPIPEGFKKMRRWVARGMFLVFILLFLGEAGARVYYYRLHHNLSYLTIPFGLRGASASQADAALPAMGTSGQGGLTYQHQSDCSGRIITVTLNNERGRGKEFTLPKPPGTFRIILLGDSVAFGADSPDDANCSVLLEQQLRQRTGAEIEVLNASKPGARIDDLVYWLENRLVRYQPDMVICSEGWNDTPQQLSSEVEANVTRLHYYTKWGPWIRKLHYKSMLYTCLLEKVQFSNAQALRAGILPRVNHYGKTVARFAKITQQMGATAVWVIQANDSETKPIFQTLVFDPPRETREAILRFAKGDSRKDFNEAIKLQFYQAQVLAEVARRSGRDLGFQVLDPRPAFIAYPGAEPLFCGPVHLTDAGHQLLAAQVAQQLSLTSLQLELRDVDGNG